MTLPNRNKAYIPSAKLHHYLLSPTHAAGQNKAQFFRQLGFRKANVELLETELLSIAQTQKTSSPFGVKYGIDGFLQTPSGNVVSVRTIWVVEHNEYHPRFVTAYPTAV